MTINKAALELIKTSEGFVDHWYPDPGTGGAPWTCCYGHTSAAGLPHYSPGQTFTIAQGEAILQQDLAGAESVVRALVKVPLTDNQFGALVSFVFNVGTSNFANSTMLRLLNSGAKMTAAEEFPRWNHAAGRVLPGLTTRRLAERALFLTPAIGTAPTGGQIVVTPAPTSFWEKLIAAIIAFFNRKV